MSISASQTFTQDTLKKQLKKPLKPYDIYTPIFVYDFVIAQCIFSCESLVQMDQTLKLKTQVFLIIIESKLSLNLQKPKDNHQELFSFLLTNNESEVFERQQYKNQMKSMATIKEPHLMARDSLVGSYCLYTPLKMTLMAPKQNPNFRQFVNVQYSLLPRYFVIPSEVLKSKGRKQQLKIRPKVSPLMPPDVKSLFIYRFELFTLYFFRNLSMSRFDEECYYVIIYLVRSITQRIYLS